MKQQFEVIATDDDTMTLKINVAGGCGTCVAKNGCGTGILSDYFAKFSTFQQPKTKNAVVGAFVEVEMATKTLFFRAFLLYIAPILMLFLGSGLGEWFFPASEGVQIGLGLLAFLTTLLLVKVFVK